MPALDPKAIRDSPRGTWRPRPASACHAADVDGQGAARTPGASGPVGALAGRLLIAAPSLGDRRFVRSAVLILDHGPADGALGVVLDRPSELPVADVLPGWAALATAPARVHIGGPVAPSTAICLASMRAVAPRSAGFAPVPGAGGRLRTVDLDLDPELVAPQVSALRVYAGYAGWAAGQLEDELADDAWYVVPVLPDDPFALEPERLWRAVLARQDGPLARLATLPLDPSQN